MGVTTQSQLLPLWLCGQVTGPSHTFGTTVMYASHLCHFSTQLLKVSRKTRVTVSNPYLSFHIPALHSDLRICVQLIFLTDGRSRFALPGSPSLEGALFSPGDFCRPSTGALASNKVLLGLADRGNGSGALPPNVWPAPESAGWEAREPTL